jgi:hypothetical protein
MTIVSPPRGRTAAAVHEHRSRNAAPRFPEAAGSCATARPSQIICLATHGSAWLPTQAGPESRAETVTDRLFQLRQRRVERLCLVIPGMQTGYPGRSGHRRPRAARVRECWPVEAGDCGGRQPEAWRASWTVADRNAAKNRIWSVLRAAGEQLRKSLRFAREFAASHGLDTWVAWFDRALASSSDIPTTRTCCLPPIRRSRATLHQLRRKRGSSAAWDRGTTSGSLMALSRASTGSSRGPSTPPPCKRSRPAQTRVSARLTIGETAVQPVVR